MVRLGIILMSICLVAALVLAVTYKITEPAIQMQKTSEEKLALKEILVQADEFLPKNIEGISYYEGLCSGKVVGYVLKAKAKGYAGDIDMLVGIDDKGSIQGIEVLSQQETPGLGARITEIRQAEKKPWFLEQFKGKLAASLKMPDIQAISGATISSKAVLDTIKDEVKEFLDRI